MCISCGTRRMPYVALLGWKEGSYSAECSYAYVPWDFAGNTDLYSCLEVQYCLLGLARGSAPSDTHGWKSMLRKHNSASQAGESEHGTSRCLVVHV
jgi:hypothetical protein